MIFNRFGYHTTYLRSDNAKENNTHSMRSYCAQHGITHEFTVPYDSHQNLEERYNHTLMDGVRTLLASSKLPLTLWHYALSCITYTRNLSPSHALKAAKTPFELWSDKQPSVDHLKSFGQPVVVHTPTQQQTSKLLPRGQKGTFVGYFPNSKGYLILLSSGRCITCTYEDVVDIKTSLTVPPPSFTGTSSTPPSCYISTPSSTTSTAPIRSPATPSELPTPLAEQEVLHNKRLGSFTYQDISQPAPQDINAGSLHSKRQPKPPLRLLHQQSLVANTSTDSAVPVTNHSFAPPVDHIVNNPDALGGNTCFRTHQDEP